MADEVVDTPFGKFLIPKGDVIGETLRAGTLWDGPGFLQPIAIEHGDLGDWGTTILDIGANLGSFSIWLASMGAWRVIAVEPIPETINYLKANLDLNKESCANVVIPLSVAAYSSTTPLSAPNIDRHHLGRTSLTPDPAGSLDGRPLDDYSWLFGERVSLIKIDAQGCDGHAILGLKQTINVDHPVIVFEWEVDLAAAHALSLDELLDWLDDWGYTVHPWPTQQDNYLAVPR